MKQKPNTIDLPDTEPAAQPPRRGEHTEPTLDTILSSMSMKRTVSLPRDLQKGLIVIAVILSVTLLFGTAVLLLGGAAFWSRDPSTEEKPTPTDKETAATPGGVDRGDPTYPYADGLSGSALLRFPDTTAAIPASLIGSSHAALADVSAATVIASRLGDEPMYPASMTKVMTLIVAVEHLPYESSLQDTITISQAVYDRMVAEGSSGIGFEPNEQISVEALLYALMLQSDGIAAGELANYIAGSEEAFVKLMNEKASSMGLSVTHFENATGLHHENHKSTAREIASIMAYAMNMKLCRKIMTTEHFRAPFLMANGQQKHYDIYNRLLVHTFTDNPDHHPSGLKVLTGKTGYTPEAGSCLVTYAEAPDGRGFVCVTADTLNVAACISDYMAIYTTYAKP